MKTLYVKQPKKQKYFNVFMGAIFLIQGVLNILNEGPGYHLALASIQIGLAFFFILYGYSFIDPRSSNKPRILLSEYNITFHKGLFQKPKSIHLEDIKLIQLKPERLSIMLKEYDFTHSFEYEGLNKNELQETIEEYAKQNAIPIERIEYR